MTRINGLAVPDDQVSRLTAELHKQSVEGPHQRVSGDVADLLLIGGDIDLTGEEALAPIEAITAAGIDNDALVERLRRNLGAVDETA
jgi:hypothetical protein